MNEIIQGDCVQLMSTMESNSVDLVVTSPPYDDLRKYQGYSFDFEAVANQLYRIVKKDGRKFIGMDISEKYCEIARRRTNG